MEYITIYDVHTQQNGFNNNGLAVLCPISCEITEKANGEYSLSMVHPIDEYGIWRNINCFNHIKALGQIFTIRDVEHVYTGNQGKINVYADHIFYKMNDPWIFPFQDVDEPINIVSGSTATEIIQSAMSLASRIPFPDSIDYTFDFDSDVVVPQAYSREITEGCTLLDAIIGDDGFMGEFGGELYRDNFHFSIRQEREGTLRNAFDIRVGLNLIGVKRRVDISKFCSYFRGYDHLGQWYAWAFHEDFYASLPIGNSVVRSQNFKFDTDDYDVSMSNLKRATTNYWQRHLKPNISYTVDLRDVKNNPDFKQFGNHFRYRVGDYGRLYDERIGGALELRITETVKDAITGETLKVVFGDLSGFVKESSYTPVPEFPTLPPKPWEVKVVLLDSNLEETENIQYFDNLASAKSALDADTSHMYNVYVNDKSKITSIANNAFYSVRNLSYFYMGDSVTSVDSNAFRLCTSLLDVRFSSNLESIGVYGFGECRSLNNAILPEGLQEIGDRVFASCKNIRRIVIPNGVISIGTEVLSNNNYVESIVIPDSVTTIGSGFGLITNCTALKSVTFSKNAKDIPVGCVTICPALTSITIPEGVETIGNAAFRDCSALETITLPSTITSIGRRLGSFEGCTSLTEIIIKAPKSQVANASYAPWGATNATVTWVNG